MPPRGRGRRRVRVLRRPAVRQRPAALRPPADRLREGRRPPLPDDARQAGRAPLRLGLPRPAGRGGGREGARHRRAPGDHRVRHRQASTTPAAPACCGTPASGSATSPARPAGSTSRTTTRRWTSTYMESVMWAFKTLWDKGLVYEGYQVLAYCWRCETPLSATPRPGWTTSTATARTRRSRWGSSSSTTPATDRRGAARVDDHAVDAAVEPGPRRRPRHRLRGRRARTASRYILAEAAARRLRSRAGRARTRVGTVKGAELVGRRYTPLFPFFADTPERVPGPRRRLRHHRGRHRRRPPGARLRRGRPDVCERRRHPDDRARWTSTAGSPPRSPTGPACTCSTPTRS